ncbi:MAG: FAD-dependent oxidoreductase, partial [Evtepia sp.]
SPKVVETEDGVFYGKTVILATGASPRELGVPGERDLRGRGVSYCATCDGMFYRGKSVVIAGGGNTAVADALFLAKICKRVVLVHRREELRASKVYMNALKDTPNIEFVWNSVVTDILQETNVTGVRVRNKKTEEVTVIPCDGIFVAIGNLPNTDLVKDQITLDEGGYVIADETTQTNIPGVFAIGDMRKKPLRQIVTAVADGAVASKYAEEFILI